MSENIIYIKSRLTLLPEYADNKATLLKQHKEPSHEEVMERLADKLTETIKFVQYGLEDGPDMELFNQDDSISSMIVPGDWMPKAAKIHELPRIAAVDTPSVKYRPGAHDLIAVFAGYGDTSDVTGFKFIAWFLAEEIELFAAGSRDLARKMHDKKWDADFNREWYVLCKHFKNIFSLVIIIRAWEGQPSPHALSFFRTLLPTSEETRHMTDIIVRAAVKLRRVERGTPEWRPYPDIRGRNKPQGAEEKAAEAAKSEEVGTRGDEGASQPGEATGSANEVDAQEPAERDETKVEGRKEEGVMDKEATAEMEGDETKEVGEVVGGGETMAATVEDAKVEVKREESKGAEEAAEGCEAKAAQMEEAKVEIKAEEPKEPRNAAEGGKVKDTQVETAKELKEEFKGQVEKDAEALAEEEEMREQAIRDEEDKLVEAKGQA